MSDKLWNNDEPVNELIERFDLDLDVPAWIDQKITPYDIAAIEQGGCASGAYMPAVTYSDARNTMAAHGDDVLEYVVDSYGELPKPPAHYAETWSRLACFYLSCAVEIYACAAYVYLDENLPEPLPEHFPQGSVSHGTLRSEDLLPEFLTVLDALDTGDDYAALKSEARGFADKSYHFTEMPETAGEIVNELIEALTDLAPQGWYFGAHEGDGSDFGFWLISY